MGVALGVVATPARGAPDHQDAASARVAPPFNPGLRGAHQLVQNHDDSNDSEVPPDQVEKYVAVYKDMQRNRSLTVATAAAQEGLTVAEFRDLERKVGRDEAAREHVRTELQAGAETTP